MLELRKFETKFLGWALFNVGWVKADVFFSPPMTLQLRSCNLDLIKTDRYLKKANVHRRFERFVLRLRILLCNKNVASDQAMIMHVTKRRKTKHERGNTKN